MAIDRVKKATFLVPRKEAHRLLDGLHSLSVIHIQDASQTLAVPEDAATGTETVSADKADNSLKKLDAGLVDRQGGLGGQLLGMRDGLVNPGSVFFQELIEPVGRASQSGHCLHKFMVVVGELEAIAGVAK